ncbi:MAG: acyl-ACP desaturase [Bacteroidota bacterium]|nr:acyl-ACP desaturase [Bacteroidota bacterium]
MHENSLEVNVTSPQFEVVKSLEQFVSDNIPTLLKPIEESWQPADFFPDMSKGNWKEELENFRKPAQELPDDVLVVLVGDMITEEALPSYQTWLNRFAGVNDKTGTDATGWAKWSRGWTSEENRHGDILNRYLYLTGRVDMQSVERTIHYLINSGFNTESGNDPYLGFIYTSFQERATKISHRNVGVLAKKAGEERLHKMCGLIAGDEARHEKAYKLFMSKIFELDPKNAILAFAKMMKQKVTMPATLMFDGKDVNIYSKFSNVAQKIEVYTVTDYSQIIQHLVEEWKIAGLQGLSDATAKAQDYLCTLSERYAKLAERIKISGSAQFSWIYDREISLSDSNLVIQNA